MRKNSFTLVELLIVIIIIGILATMAVPQYQKMMEKAKGAEAMQMSSLIRKAEIVYYAQYDNYIDIYTTFDYCNGTGTIVADWGALDMDNPNAVSGQFYYDVVPAGVSGMPEWWVRCYKRNDSASPRWIDYGIESGKALDSSTYPH